MQGQWPGRSHSDRRAQQHDLLVGLRETARRLPLRPACQSPDALQRSGIDSTLAAARQQVAKFGGKTHGAERRSKPRRPTNRRIVTVLDVTGEQLADDAVLLGAGDQPRRWGPVALRGEPQHRERVRMHRAHQRLAHHRAFTGAEQCRCDRGLGLGAQTRRTRQQQNRFRIASRAQMFGRRVHQQPALPGSGPTEHSHGTAHLAATQCGRCELDVWRRHEGMTPRGSDKLRCPAAGTDPPVRVRVRRLAASSG